MAVSKEIPFAPTVTVQLPIIMRNPQDAEIKIDLVKNGKGISIAVFNINQDGKSSIYYQDNQCYTLDVSVPLTKKERSDLQERICFIIDYLRLLQSNNVIDDSIQKMMEEYYQFKQQKGQQTPEVKKEKKDKQNPEIKKIKRRMEAIRRQITSIKQQFSDTFVVISKKGIDRLQNKLNELEKQLGDLQQKLENRTIGNGCL